VCSYVHSDWNNAGNGFRTISDPYGAQRVWLGDTCQSGSNSLLWVRTHFTVPEPDPAPGDCADTDHGASGDALQCSPGVSCRSCQEVVDAGLSSGSGVYALDPCDAGTATNFYCDMDFDGGGWTLLGSQRSSAVSTVAPLREAFSATWLATVHRVGLPT
jgi:hypothetical protein